MAEDSKIHTGHRRRMRSRVAENGFSSLEPHEALECLLYITNARKNTNRMAHELIDRFGVFAGVLVPRRKTCGRWWALVRPRPGCCI